MLSLIPWSQDYNLDEVSGGRNSSWIDFNPKIWECTPEVLSKSKHISILLLEFSDKFFIHLVKISTQKVIHAINIELLYSIENAFSEFVPHLWWLFWLTEENFHSNPTTLQATKSISIYLLHLYQNIFLSLMDKMWLGSAS